jgi:O-antigen ligase
MNRLHLIFTVALVTLLGSIVALFSTIQERDYALRGYVDATQNADLPYRMPLLGVNADLTQYSLEALHHQFDLMQQAHITWVRQVVRWDEIEPQQGQYRWETWDSIVDAVQSFPDLELVVVLLNSPDWARPVQPNDNPMTPPDDPATFAAFAAAFANRYGQSIDYYQIWDEPNLTAAWGDSQPRPADYAVMLQSAYTAIHSADARATVIAAALAPTTEQGPENISDILYLRDLYAFGARDFMDAAAAKPYGFDASPSDRAVDSDILNFSRLIALREEMVRNGDGHKALWGSAWGWNSLPDTWTGTPSIWGSVTEAQRTQYTIESLDRAEREWTWLGGLILQTWQPIALPDDPMWGFALIHSQGNPTPLWSALVQRAPATTAMNGLFPAVNPYARYSGVWTFSTLGADIGWIRPTDSQLEFTFTGTDAALLLREDDYVAYLYPTIDGQPANAVPRDPEGTAYIVLTSDSLFPETSLVQVSHGLGYGAHTLRIVADRGEDRWALAGYAVSSGDLAAPYRNQLSVALFTTVVAGISVLVTGWQINWRALLKPFNSLWHRLNDAGQLIISAVTSIALLIGMLLTWGDTVPSLFRRDEIPLALVITSAGLLKLELHLVLTLVSIIVLFFIIYNRLDFGLMLTLFWSPFFMFPIELYSFAFPIAEIMILLTGVAAFLRLFAAWGRERQTSNSRFPLPTLQQFAHRLHTLDYGVIAWVILAFVSLLWAARQKEAFTELRTMIIEPAIFYIVLRSQITNRKTLLLLVDTLLLAGFVVSVIGLYQYFTGQAIITAEEGARRLASVYGSPNNVGLFLGRCIPFALAFLLIPIAKSKPKHKLPLLSPILQLGIRRVFAFLNLLVMGFAVALTQSVGAIFIGVPAAIAAVLLAVWGKRAWLAIGGLAGIGALAMPFLLQSERFARVLDFSQGTNFYRIRVWQSALNVIRDHPITGLGLDQFLYAFQGQYILPDAWQEPNLSHPHNFFLDAWVRLGIFGVLVFLWIQWIFWRSMRQLYLRFQNIDPLLFAIIVGAIGSMVNLLAHGLIDNSIYVQDLVFVYVLLLGLAVQPSNIKAIDGHNEMMV